MELELTDRGTYRWMYNISKSNKFILINVQAIQETEFLAICSVLAY